MAAQETLRDSSDGNEGNGDDNEGSRRPLHKVRIPE